jgi:predicted oxidoreductase (fatty acid repression mutant protein)
MFGLVAGIIFLINYFKQNKLLKERLMNVPKNSKNNISDIKKVNEHNKHLNSSFKSQTRKIIIDEKNHSRIVKMPTKKIKVDIEEKKGKK